jgi:hypothetical protein
VLLAAGIDTRPASMSYLPADSPSPSASSSHALVAPALSSTGHHSDTTSTPLAQPQARRSTASTKALNDATVELEHRKFEEEPIIPAEDMDGLTTIDYWLVRVCLQNQAWISSNYNVKITMPLQAKSSDLPLVHRVALDILPAQASSVSSERVFSSSKLTCTQLRNHISAANVEALQVLKHSLRCRHDTPLFDSPETLDSMAHH